MTDSGDGGAPASDAAGRAGMVFRRTSGAVDGAWRLGGLTVHERDARTRRCRGAVAVALMESHTALQCPSPCQEGDRPGKHLRAFPTLHRYPADPDPVGQSRLRHLPGSSPGPQRGGQSPHFVLFPGFVVFELDAGHGRTVPWIDDGQAEAEFGRPPNEMCHGGIIFAGLPVRQRRVAHVQPGGQGTLRKARRSAGGTELAQQLAEILSDRCFYSQHMHHMFCRRHGCAPQDSRPERPWASLPEGSYGHGGAMSICALISAPCKRSRANHSWGEMSRIQENGLAEKGHCPRAGPRCTPALVPTPERRSAGETLACFPSAA